MRQVTINTGCVNRLSNVMKGVTGETGDNKYRMREQARQYDEGCDW